MSHYTQGIRDERERVRKLLKCCLRDAIDNVPDEALVGFREEQIRCDAVQDSLGELLLVLDNWQDHWTQRPDWKDPTK